MGRHHRVDAGRDGGAERHQLARPEDVERRVDDGQVQVRVDGGVAVAGEVLGAAPPPRRACSPRTKAAPCRATSAGSAPNERTPITGLAGSLLTSTHGARSRSMPAAASSAPIDAATASVQRRVVDGPERGVARVRAAGAHSRRVTSPPSSSSGHHRVLRAVERSSVVRAGQLPAVERRCRRTGTRPPRPPLERCAGATRARPARGTTPAGSRDHRVERSRLSPSPRRR